MTTYVDIIYNLVKRRKTSTAFFFGDLQKKEIVMQASTLDYGYYTIKSLFVCRQGTVQRLPFCWLRTPVVLEEWHDITYVQ